jgi:hypothetical protein
MLIILDSCRNCKNIFNLLSEDRFLTQKFNSIKSDFFGAFLFGYHLDDLQIE